MPDIPLLERTLLNLTAIHLDTILNSGRKVNATHVSNFFIETRVVSYTENLDLSGFSVFYISTGFS